MTYDEAVKLAVETLRRRIQNLAVEANLHDLYGANHAAALAASANRIKLMGAIEVLQAGPLAGEPVIIAGDWSGYETCTICFRLIRYDLRQQHFEECQAAFLAAEIPTT